MTPEENKVINIGHQLQRTSDMRLVIEFTKKSAGTRKLPMTEDVAQRFRAIIDDREEPRCERMVGGYAGFLFTDKNGYPEVAMHWEHRFNHMVKRYNDIYRVQVQNITPHICRHKMICILDLYRNAWHLIRQLRRLYKSII